MNAELVVTCLLSSSLAVAFITGIKEILLWIMNRKAKLSDEKKEDNKEEEEKKDTIKEDILDIKSQLVTQESMNKKVIEILDKLEKKLDINADANRMILKDRIRFIAMYYINLKTISFDDRKSLHDMWKLYHYGLGGNGDLDSVMKMIDELPLDVREEGKSHE